MFARLIFHNEPEAACLVRSCGTHFDVPLNDYALGDWQRRIALKFSMVRGAAHIGFERFADQTLTPIFEELTRCTSESGSPSVMMATMTVAHPGVRAYKFAVTRQACLTITFRAYGLRCDVLNEFSVPNYRISPTYDSVDLLDADEEWARRVFEEALDIFVDAVSSVVGRP